MVFITRWQVSMDDAPAMRVGGVVARVGDGGVSLRVRAPNVSDEDKANGGVSDEDKANGGVPYATNFVANWGNEDGQRAAPGRAENSRSRWRRRARTAPALATALARGRA